MRIITKITRNVFRLWSCILVHYNWWSFCLCSQWSHLKVYDFLHICLFMWINVAILFPQISHLNDCFFGWTLLCFFTSFILWRSPHLRHEIPCDSLYITIYSTCLAFYMIFREETMFYYSPIFHAKHIMSTGTLTLLFSVCILVLFQLFRFFHTDHRENACPSMLTFV